MLDVQDGAALATMPQDERMRASMAGKPSPVAGAHLTRCSFVAASGAQRAGSPTPRGH
jgi:hypothetical protein